MHTVADYSSEKDSVHLNHANIVPYGTTMVDNQFTTQKLDNPSFYCQDCIMYIPFPYNLNYDLPTIHKIIDRWVKSYVTALEIRIPLNELSYSPSVVL